jgi:putative transposase
MIAGMSRNIAIGPGEFYHVYNRGTEKRDIFKDETDYDRFTSLLYVSNGNTPVHLQLQGRTLKEVLEVDRGEPLVDIGAYCLMPNHFHLLLTEKTDNGISKFMQKLTTGYTMYFNKRYERNGSLFQGKFKASHAQEDRYLKYLLSYIHLNPIKLLEPQWKESGIKDKKIAEEFLETYTYSSFLDYLGKTRAENKLINTEILPKYYEMPKDFKTSVSEWLDFKVEP